MKHPGPVNRNRTRSRLAVRSARPAIRSASCVAPALEVLTYPRTLRSGSRRALLGAASGGSKRLAGRAFRGRERVRSGIRVHVSPCGQHAPRSAPPAALRLRFRGALRQLMSAPLESSGGPGRACGALQAGARSHVRSAPAPVRIVRRLICCAQLVAPTAGRCFRIASLRQPPLPWRRIVPTHPEPDRVACGAPALRPSAVSPPSRVRACP
jgi:hypothetical protein